MFPEQNASFERLTDAKRWAQQTESAIREGRHFKTTEAKRRTLGEMIDRYITDSSPQAKNLKNRSLHLNWWKSELGKYTLADITPAVIAEHKDKLTKATTSRGKLRSPSTVVPYMAALSHAFTLAVKARVALMERSDIKVLYNLHLKASINILTSRCETLTTLVSLRSIKATFSLNTFLICTAE